MDRLESMSTLVAAVDAGSFSAASRRLGMPLPTVSRKVAELEAHLRTRLLNRSSRRLTLTDAGRSYLAACKRILEHIGEAERAATGEYAAPKGDLTLSAPIVFGRLHVLPIVADFLLAFPDIDVRLVLSDRVVNLLEEPVDIAIRIGDLADSSLFAARIGAVQQIVCGSPAYLGRRGIPKRPEDLRDHDCVTFEAISSAHSWIFQAGNAGKAGKTGNAGNAGKAGKAGKTTETVVAVRSRLAVNTAEAAVDAAVAGVGLTRVISYQAAAAEHAGLLTRVLRSFEPSAMAVSLVYTGQPLLPLKLRAFLDFTAPRLKTRLAETSARLSRAR